MIVPACVAAAALAIIPAPGDDPPVGLADLESYRAALSTRPSGPAPSVGFRDLWDRAGDHAGKAVTVGGRVARLFRQPAVGTFPPLVEAWVVSPSGDPTCLVFPQLEGRAGPEVGASVRFSGTFLKQIRYHGGDVPRLAPLIVGPDPPTLPEGSSAVAWPSWSSGDWMMGVGACLVVALFMARRHLARPIPMSPGVGPAPSFIDGDDEEDPSDEIDRRA